MRTEDFMMNAEKVAKENKLLRRFISALLVLVFMMGVWMTSLNQTVVIIPPNMPTKAVISIDSANRDYKKAYSVYVASMIGNVDKNNAQITNKGIIDLLDISIKSKFEDILADQLNSIKKNDLRIYFSTTKIAFDPETDKVFVTGNRVLDGRGGKKRIITTFEFIIKIKNYSPVITHIDVYEGGPKIGEKDE